MRLSRMKRLMAIGFVVAALAIIGSASAVFAGKGNDSPTGPHYNLNIIGTSDKSADMDGNNGHRIFVKLSGKSKIYLKEAPEGESFKVLDANGTDGNGATFQLPNPDPDNDGSTTYSVFARALGKPGGEAVIVTCATDPDTDGEVCSLATLEVKSTTGKGSKKFQNVSKELLYIYADIDGTGVKRYPLFDDRLEDYLWSYDNNGLRLLQLRFYMCTTIVPSPENWGDPVSDDDCFN